jgi:uncharacterized membrane protein
MMKKSIIMVLVLIAASFILAGFVNSQSSTGIKYTKYVNDRYGFSIDYPSTFVIDVVPENDDGRIFLSKDKLTEFTVCGSNNVLDYTVNSIFNELKKEHKKIPYIKKGKNWVVGSWVEGNKIVYHKSIIGKGSINEFIIKYPTKQKDYYSSIITNLDKSFITPYLSECH